MFSFPFTIPEADFHYKPQKTRLHYVFFPSTHIFISSLSSQKHFCRKRRKKKKKINFSRCFFSSWLLLLGTNYNCFTAEPKQHSQQNHSLSILKQSERLDAKEQRWDRHQPNRPRRNTPLVLRSPGSLVGQNVNFW